MTLRALIFDVDGTLAETEEAHRQSFNAAFAAAGHGWHWDVDTYRALLRVTGGQQRIRHFLDTIGAEATLDEIAALHASKNRRYAERVAGGGVARRPGVARLIADARASGLRLAIATTTSRSNLEALLVHLFAPDAVGWFAAIVAGEDVAAKKPDPEVYVRTLAQLGVTAGEAVAIEDSRNGLLAAAACGIATIVTPSFYSRGEDVSGAALVCRDLDEPPVDVPLLTTLVERA